MLTNVPTHDRVMVKRQCKTCAKDFFMGLLPGGVKRLPVDCPRCRQKRGDLF